MRVGELDNPYRSPLSEESDSLDLPYEPRAELLTAGWLYRKVRIMWPIDAVIEYTGRLPAYDQVKVDGRVAQRVIIWFWFANRFEFAVPTSQGPAKVQIRLRVDLWTRITRFSIAAGDRIVYREVRNSSLMED